MENWNKLHKWKLGWNMSALALSGIFSFRGVVKHWRNAMKLHRPSHFGPVHCGPCSNFPPKIGLAYTTTVFIHCWKWNENNQSSDKNPLHCKYNDANSCREVWEIVHVGLAEWIKHPLKMLEVRGSNTTPSENTTSLPRSPKGSPRAHRLISVLSEGDGVKQTNKKPARYRQAKNNAKKY